VATADGWEAAFIAASVAFGASVDEAFASLGDEAGTLAEGFAKSLAHSTREARAKALAAGLARIAVAVEKGRLA
jgi:hypothetical protein